jgi:V/A-type H+-transporting ATPase subunit F
MHKICIIGDRDSVLGFKALGYYVFTASDAYEAERIFEKIVKDYAIIFIVEEYARELKGTIDNYRDRKLPAVIPVPGSRGPTGLCTEIIKDAMERAVGADILVRDE